MFLIAGKMIAALKRSSVTSGCLLGFALVLLLLARNSFALELKQDAPVSLELAKAVLYLPGNTPSFPLEEALLKLKTGAFAAHEKPTLSLGLGPASCWLSFSLVLSPVNGQEIQTAWLLVLDWAFIDQVRLYASKPGPDKSDSTWQEVKPVFDPPGKTVLRPPAPKNVYALPLTPGKETRFMLKVNYAGPTNLHPTLVRQTDFLVLNSRRSALVGIYYGLVLAMVLYNLAMFVSLKDNSYLWYGFYILAMALYFMFLNGILAGTGPRTHLFFLGLIFVGGAQFTRHFFMTPKVAPLADKVFLAYLGLSIILIIGNLFLPPLPLFALGMSGGVGPLLSIGVGIYLWRSGFAGARFFVLAWFLLSLGIGLFILTLTGAIPISPWSLHAFQVTAALETVILSLSLADRVKGLRKSQNFFKIQALTDTLTGLFNKRHFETQLELHLRRVRREKGDLSLIMLDVDKFKEVNDRHGHPQGDAVLARLGSVLNSSIREGDIACRYGGEEFSIILPETSLEIAGEVAERIRKTAAIQVFAPAKPLSSFKVTVSLGVAAWQEGEDTGDLVSKADRALYQAKNLGRNKTVCN